MIHWTSYISLNNLYMYQHRVNFTITNFSTILHVFLFHASLYSSLFATIHSQWVDFPIDNVYQTTKCHDICALRMHTTVTGTLWSWNGVNIKAAGNYFSNTIEFESISEHIIGWLPFIYFMFDIQDGSLVWG